MATDLQDSPKTAEEMLGDSPTAEELLGPEPDSEGLIKGTGRGFASGANTGVGSLLKGVGALENSPPLIPQPTKPMSPGFSGLVKDTVYDLLHPPGLHPAARNLNATPAETMAAIQKDPAYKAGKYVSETGQQIKPEHANLVNKAAEMMGGLLPVVLTGPLAPATMGVQAYGSTIDDQFSKYKKQGLSDDEAAAKAMTSAELTGLTQTALWMVLPKPLQSIVSKVTGKIGGTALKEFLARRASGALSGAGLGAASRATENLTTGEPVGKDVGASALAMGALGGVVGLAAKGAQEGLRPGAPRPINLRTAQIWTPEQLQRFNQLADESTALAKGEPNAPETQQQPTGVQAKPPGTPLVGVPPEAGVGNRVLGEAPGGGEEVPPKEVNHDWNAISKMDGADFDKMVKEKYPRGVTQWAYDLATKIDASDLPEMKAAASRFGKENMKKIMGGEAQPSGMYRAQLFTEAVRMREAIDDAIAKGATTDEQLAAISTDHGVGLGGKSTTPEERARELKEALAKTKPVEPPKPVDQPVNKVTPREIPKPKKLKAGTPYAIRKGAVEYHANQDLLDGGIKGPEKDRLEARQKELVAQYQKSLQPVKRGSWTAWSYHPSGTKDVLDDIFEEGGVASPTQSRFASKGDYDGYSEAFSGGMAVRLRRSSGGLPPDKLVQALNDRGYNLQSTSDLYDAVQKAVAERQGKGGGRAAQEQKIIELESKQASDFSDEVNNPKNKAAVVNAGDALAVGSEFRFRGEKFKVTEFDPDSDTYVVEDGQRFGRQFLSADDSFDPDPGSVSKKPEADFDTGEANAKPSGFRPPEQPKEFKTLKDLLAYREAYRQAELDFYRSLGLDEKDALKMFRAGDARSNIDTESIEAKLTPENRARLDQFSTGEGSEMYQWDKMFDPSRIEGETDKSQLARGIVGAFGKEGMSPGMDDKFIFSAASLRQLAENGGTWSDIARALDRFTTENSGSQSDKAFLFKRMGQEIRDFAKTQGIDLGQGELGAKLGQGQNQGDLLDSTQKQDLTLTGEQGSDAERLAAQKAKADADAAEAKRIADEQQGNLFGDEGAGPGGTVPEDVGGKPQLAQLTDAMRTLAEQNKTKPEVREAYNLGKKWAAAKDAGSRALIGLRTAGSYLLKKLQGKPVVNTLDRILGPRHYENSYSISNARDYLNTQWKAVPKFDRREAISNYLDMGGDDAKLRQAEAETKPQYKKGYANARNLTPEEKTVAQNIKNYFESRLKEGRSAGVLDAAVSDYIHRMYERDSDWKKGILSELTSGISTRKPGLAMKRVFEYDYEAEKAGYKPIKDFARRVAEYDVSLNKAIADRKAVKAMLELKMPDGRPMVDVAGIGKEVTADDDEGSKSLIINPKAKVSGKAKGGPDAPINNRGDYAHKDYPALKKWRWVDTDANGKDTIIQGDVLIHPDAVGKLAALFERSKIRKVAIGRAALQVSSTFKQTAFDLSGFHPVQITTHGAEHSGAHMLSQVLRGEMPNPIKSFKPVEKIDFNDPDVRGLIKGGMTVGDSDGWGLFSEGLSGSSLTRHIPGVGPKLQDLQEALFDDYIPRVKTAMALHALENNRARYKNLTEEELHKLTANQANAAFGGLNWEMMGVSRTTRDVLRLALVAPDFLLARGKFVGQAGTVYGREQLSALMLGAATLYVTARILNKLMDDKYHFEPKNAFNLVHGGKAYSLRTVQGDLMHSVFDTSNFIYHRLNPVFGRTLMEGITKRDEFGRKRTAAQQFGDFAKNIVPISVRGLLNSREQNLLESALNAFGITERRNTDIDNVYAMAENYKKANNIAEPAERIYDPDKDPYRGIKLAGLYGTPEKTADEIRDALKSRSISAPQLFRHFEGYVSRPFTGSKAHEARFIAGLTEDQKKIYLSAIDERKKLITNLQKGWQLYQTQK